MMSDEIYKTIGRKIRLLRESLKMSQQELAGAVGLQRTSITNIELGNQKLPIDALYDIAQSLGVAARDLLPDEYPNPAIAEAYERIAELQHQQSEEILKLRRMLALEAVEP